MFLGSVFLSAFQACLARKKLNANIAKAMPYVLSPKLMQTKCALTVSSVSRSHLKKMSVLNVMLLRMLSANLVALYSLGRNAGLSMSNLGQYGFDAFIDSHGSVFTSAAFYSLDLICRNMTRT